MIRAIHAFPTWLPLTQTWMHNQVRFLPDTVETHVVCEVTEHLDQFPVPNLWCLADAPAWRSVWDRGLRKLRMRSHLGFLTSVIRTLKADLVHSHFGYVACANMGAIARTSAKHVVTFYGADATQTPRTDPGMRIRYLRLFEHADMVLCEGPIMAEQVIELGCPREKARVHHLGVALDGLPYRPREWDGRSPLRVLIAGTFREKKGIPYAVDAVGRVAKETNVELTIIGDATAKPGDAQERQKILEQIERHDLSARTRLLGFQPFDRLLAESYGHHVFLSPSVTAADGDAEGGAPVTIIEMAATGMPIVSTKHCDIPGVVVDEQTGWLAPERDVDALVAHLRWLIRHPGGWRARLDAGRRRMELEFDCRTQGRRLAEAYASLLH